MSSLTRETGKMRVLQSPLFSPTSSGADVIAVVPPVLQGSTLLRGIELRLQSVSPGEHLRDLVLRDSAGVTVCSLEASSVGTIGPGFQSQLDLIIPDGVRVEPGYDLYGWFRFEGGTPHVRVYWYLEPAPYDERIHNMTELRECIVTAGLATRSYLLAGATRLFGCKARMGQAGLALVLSWLVALSVLVLVSALPSCRATAPVVISNVNQMCESTVTNSDGSKNYFRCRYDGQQPVKAGGNPGDDKLDLSGAVNWNEYRPSHPRLN